MSLPRVRRDGPQSSLDLQVRRGCRGVVTTLAELEFVQYSPAAMDSPMRDGQLIREELERVLSSAVFARSERASKLLRFLVERHIEGRDDELKESVIGVEVFGRKADYDPKLDSTVRTEVVRLRSRMAQYYSTEGSQNPL